jgi:YbbR domain-containing protein
VLAPVSGLPGVRRLQTRQLRVVPVDEQAREVADVLVVPAEVEVAIRPRRSGVRVPVVAEISGAESVADGYDFVAVSVEPKIVELEGPADLVREINNEGRVFTEPVDLTGASSDIQRRVALAVPEGVTAQDSPGGVTVTVEVQPLPGTLALDVRVDTRRLDTGREADITPDRVQVLLRGPRPDLAPIDAQDVHVYVDLIGLGPGTYRQRVRVEPPANMQVLSTTPEEVDVVIREGAAVTPTPTRLGTDAR